MKYKYTFKKDDCINGDFVFIKNYNIIFDIKRDRTSATDKKFGIFIFEKDLLNAKIALCANFDFLCRNFLVAEDNELSPFALKLKLKLKRIFKVYELEETNNG